ncbi:hypothetical protein AB0E69_33925 [Kribbella sp. NPDC026611]|uniref:hypothetical protein n=1 Tax=Kribbella sp. NPDC026611 TaxID=3154911 RepID=UPI0033F3A766
MNRQLTALTGSTVLALAALVPTAADAHPQAAANACYVWQGGIDGVGGHHFSTPTASSPPTVMDNWGTPGVYKSGAVRLSSRQTMETDIDGYDNYGYVVIADALYYSYYLRPADGTVKYQSLTRLGGGWAGFRYLEVSQYQSPEGTTPNVSRAASYALRSDGVLFRWNVLGGKIWRVSGSYPGFSAVKTMTLIAKTPTYDTFLANTRGGALYTIRIPTTSPVKPVVRQVRTSGWQRFEALMTMACGRNGNLLLALDKDADSPKAYLYAVGHANGLSTVIQPRGQVPAAPGYPVDFRWVQLPVYDVANGD